MEEEFTKGGNYILLLPFLREGGGGFFIKIKIPLASTFVKGRNYLKSPSISLCKKGENGGGKDKKIFKETKPQISRKAIQWALKFLSQMLLTLAYP